MIEANAIFGPRFSRPLGPGTPAPQQGVAPSLAVQSVHNSSMGVNARQCIDQFELSLLEPTGLERPACIDGGHAEDRNWTVPQMRRLVHAIVIGLSQLPGHGLSVEQTARVAAAGMAFCLKNGFECIDGLAIDNSLHDPDLRSLVMQQAPSAKHPHGATVKIPLGLSAHLPVQRSFALALRFLSN